MCTSNNDECSHIQVDPEALGYIQELQSVASTANSMTQHIIMRAVCWIRHKHQVKEPKPLPKSIKRFVEAS